MINLDEKSLDIVREVLRRHVPDRTVCIFGSRAHLRNIKKYSDIDLCIMGDKPLSLSTISDMAEDFSESDLLYRVDIVDWATTSENFRKIISSHAIELN